MGQSYTIGIDIGGTNTKIGFVSQHGHCLSASSIPTQSHLPFENFLQRVVGQVDLLKADLPSDSSLVAIGVGAPNANFYNGNIEKAPNLHWGDNVPLGSSLSKAFGLPVSVTNDANAAAVGEMKYGLAKGMSDFVVITLGTGLGSGIVSHGQLVYGHDGFAGEIGHTNYQRNGRLCGCGNYGCLETYVSATGIKRTVFELLAKYNPSDSELSTISFNELTASRIHTQALHGDPIAIEAFEITGRILGEKLADTVAHLSPEAIILFGGLANAGEFILKPCRQHLEANLLPVFRNKIKVLISNMSGDNAAILGAGALAWEMIDKKVPLFKAADKAHFAPANPNLE